MDISLSSSEQSIRDGIRRLLTREVPYDLLQSTESSDRFPGELWERLAAGEWLGVGSGPPSDHDVPLVQWALVLEEMGRVACPLPVVEHLAAVAFLAATEPEGRRLVGVAGGRSVVSVAYQDRPGGTVVVDISGQGHRISGEKMLVPFAEAATHLIVVVADPPGRSHYWVNTRAPRLTRTPIQSVSRNQHCVVRFDAVHAELMCSAGEDPQCDFLELYTLASDAYAVGLMGRMLDMSLDYVKQRVQFDHPLGHFQAVQHRCADMAAAHAGAQSLVYQAAWLLGRGKPALPQLLMCHSYCRDAAALVLGHAHQVHGAMGFVMDYPLHYFSRRAKMYEQALGQAWVHRDRFAEWEAAILHQRVTAPDWRPLGLVPH